MKIKFVLSVFLIFLITGNQFAQEKEKDPIIENIVKEANENSQLQHLGHELLDIIGPRLVGTPQMQEAHNWAVAKYKSWNISAKNEKWGEWRGWERGITHIDMITQEYKLWMVPNWHGTRALRIRV